MWPILGPVAMELGSPDLVLCSTNEMGGFAQV